MEAALETLDVYALRSACRKRGIFFPCGNPVALSNRRECINALTNPAYLKADELGLLSKEDEA